MYSLHRFRAWRGVSLVLLAASAHALQAPPRVPRQRPDNIEARSVAPDVVREAARVRAPSPVRVPLGAARKEPAPAAASTLRPERERVEFQFDADGALWARGANYKLRFAAGSARFDPFFASSAPRSFALDFTLRAVQLGGRALRFEADAAPLRDGNDVEFARGALRERYELAPRSVEQSFVFDALPRGGELVVQLDVDTELAAAHDAQGFEFANEYGSVRYGAATALDAAGRALALETTLVDGTLTLRVPAAFVASATLPLVIDPIIASFGIESQPAATLDPDVSFDASGALVLYCWEEEFNAGDHDVWSDLYDLAGNPHYCGAYVDMTATYWGRPRSANLGASNRFLIVAHTVNASSGRLEIWGRTRDTVNALLSPQFKITGASTYDVLFPDVGGDPYPSGPSFFLVAYERVYSYGSDHDIHAKLVTDAGAVSGGALGVDTSINTYDILPSVSKSDGSTNWNLAWQRASPAGGNDIFGARVAWDGVVTSPSFAIAVSALDHTNPAVSSSMQGSESWLVAYEADFGSDHDIIVSAIDTASVTRSIDLSSFDGPFMYQDQRWPSIDCDGAHFACSYSELYQTSTTDYDVYASELLSNSASLSVLEAHQGVFATDGAELESAIAARASGAPAPSTHDYALAWHRAPDNYFFTSDDILGAVFTGHAGGQVASFCDGASVVCPCGNGASNAGGCPNSAHASGAVLSWSGASSTASDTLQLFCGGLPAQTTCLFFQAAGSINGIAGTPFGDGMRCAGAPMLRLGLKSASAAGGALYPAVGDAVLSIAGQIPPAGNTVVYQVWYRDPAAFCTSATTNMSNALVVAWTP